MSKHKNDSKPEKGNEASSESSSAPVGAVVGQNAGEGGQEAGKGQELTASSVETYKDKSLGAAGLEDVKGGVDEEAVTFASALSVAQEELETARKELQKLTDELAALNDKYLRTLADDVNFRKRMVREKEESQRYAVAALLQDIIPVLDDFDRGIASAEVSKNYEQLHEGVMLIRRQLSQMLENKYALKRMESKGTPFDPNKHEALFAEQAEVEEPVVSEEYLPGYTLHDRVLRTAKVRVKMPGPKSSVPAEDSASGAGGNSDGAADRT